ncbi:MAG: DUF4124 domain-containing protein [Burkholderiales bacterium]|nr:DUF4124 domain-containing protein [Burkholderiales bacterium]
MKSQLEKYLRVVSLACVGSFAIYANAQELWKYTDKNGKVTYSDKAPALGEKAERVPADTTGTVIPASKNTLNGATQNSATVGARVSAREAVRESYRKNVDMAREELERAKKSLESGQEPSTEERQIVVGRGKDGQPTGSNAVLRKPEYYERIAALEAAVKKAEEKLENAERSARQSAPK